MKTSTTKSRHFSSSVSGDRVSSLIHRVNRDFRISLDSMTNGNHTFLFGNRSTPCYPIDAVRWLSETAPGSSESLHIRNIILSAVSESETSQGASAAVCAVTLSQLLSQSFSSVDLDRDTIDLDLRQISMCSRRASSSEILEVLSKIDSSSVSYRIAKRSIEACSSNSSIQIIEGQGLSRLQKIRGYKFSARAPDVFYSTSLARGSRKINTAKTLIVDGFIESVSEIDGLMQESFNSKNPLVIFCRGLSDEVQNTLGVNYSRGILSIVPFIVPYDHIGANLINDISIVCGSDLVSSLKGDLISTKKWCDLSHVDSIDIKFDSGFVIIENDRLSHQIRFHKKMLRKKKSESTSSAEAEIIDTRISCLSGDSLNVILGDETRDLSGIYKDRIGSHIRAYKSASRYGIVDLSIAIESISNQIIKQSLREIQKISPFYIASSLIVGIRNAFICARHLNQIGGIIYRDRN